MIPIPDFLKHLPTYRGYPVPYFVPKDENGVYQLKYFKPLTHEDYWFISGPQGLQTQTDSHPPMHKWCAEYSLQVCPHLFFEKTHRTSDESTAQPFQILQKPKEFFLVKAGKYSTVNIHGMKLIKYASHTVESRYEYVNGVLKEKI